MVITVPLVTEMKWCEFCKFLISKEINQACKKCNGGKLWRMADDVEIRIKTVNERGNRGFVRYCEMLKENKEV